MTRAIALMLFLAVLGGCRAGGSRSAEQAAEALRRERDALAARVRALEGERDEARAKLSESARLRGSPLPADVLDAVPRVVAIEIDEWSGWLPADPARDAASLGVFVVPRDGRGRFVPIVGTLTIEARHAPPEGSALPETCFERKLGPGLLRDAYRSGVTGTHYAVEFPAAVPADRRAGEWFIRAIFRDSLTGLTHETTRRLVAR